MTFYVSEGSIEVIWSHLRSFRQSPLSHEATKFAILQTCNAHCPFFVGSHKTHRSQCPDSTFFVIRQQQSVRMFVRGADKTGILEEFRQNFKAIWFLWQVSFENSVGIPKKILELLAFEYNLESFFMKTNSVRRIQPCNSSTAAGFCQKNDRQKGPFPLEKYVNNFCCGVSLLPSLRLFVIAD